MKAFFIPGLTPGLRWDQTFNVIVFWLIGILSALHLKSLVAVSDDPSVTPRTMAMSAKGLGSTGFGRGTL